MPSRQRQAREPAIVAQPQQEPRAGLAQVSCCYCLECLARSGYGVNAGGSIYAAGVPCQRKKAAAKATPVPLSDPQQKGPAKQESGRQRKVRGHRRLKPVPEESIMSAASQMSAKAQQAKKAPPPPPPVQQRVRSVFEDSEYMQASTPQQVYEQLVDLATDKSQGELSECKHETDSEYSQHEEPTVVPAPPTAPTPQTHPMLMEHSLYVPTMGRNDRSCYMQAGFAGMQQTAQQIPPSNLKKHRRERKVEVQIQVVPEEHSETEESRMTSRNEVVQDKVHADKKEQSLKGLLKYAGPNYVPERTVMRFNVDDLRFRGSDYAFDVVSETVDVVNVKTAPSPSSSMASRTTHTSYTETDDEASYQRQLEEVEETLRSKQRFTYVPHERQENKPAPEPARVPSARVASSASSMSSYAESDYMDRRQYLINTNQANRRGHSKSHKLPEAMMEQAVPKEQDAKPEPDAEPEPERQEVQKQKKTASKKTDVKDVEKQKSDVILAMSKSSAFAMDCYADDDAGSASGNQTNLGSKPLADKKTRRNEQDYEEPSAGTHRSFTEALEAVINVPVLSASDGSLYSEGGPNSEYMQSRRSNNASSCSENEKSNIYMFRGARIVEST